MLRSNSSTEDRGDDERCALTAPGSRSNAHRPAKRITTMRLIAQNGSSAGRRTRATETARPCFFGASAPVVTAAKLVDGVAEHADDGLQVLDGALR